MGLSKLKSPSTTGRTPSYFSSWKQATRWVRETVRKALEFMEPEELLEEIALVLYQDSKDESWDSVEHRIQEIETKLRYYRARSEKLEKELDRLQEVQEVD